ncbi:MAG: M61 family metallopeptidase, partial [Armatimonadetes bacterium]|nr:M61 family metallopeptidase [Armatimonadota bacterium]
LPTGTVGTGLEHTDSFSIIAGSQLLRDSESYRGKFLPIVAHEFFHAWNVKWIRPKELTSYDYSREQHTKLLWAAEGFTTYYSALILKRAGLISEKEFLKWLSDRIGSLERSWGRAFRSAEEASWDAWTPGENPGSRLSYYIKGCLLGLLLDLKIRHSTLDRKSLDDVIRLLGERFAKRNDGFTTEDLEALVLETGGESLSGFFDDYVRGVKELPLSNALSHAGLLLSGKPPRKDSPSLDVSLGDASGFPEVREIPPGSLAQQGGLDSGDVIIAVEGRRVTLSTLPEILSDYRIGDQVRITFFRREELRETRVTLTANQSREFEIKPVESPGQLEKRIYCSWLREEHFPDQKEKKEERDSLEKP